MLEDEPIGQIGDDSKADTVVQRLGKMWSKIPKSDLDASMFAVGRTVAQYELLEVIGSGSFGVVYRAKDNSLDRVVALKLPRIEVLIDPEKRKRFAAEAKLAAKLDHPNIVPIYQADLDGAVPFIASAYCDGPNLAQWIDGCDSVSDWRQSVDLIATIAGAVDHAHQMGVLHRDIKPANIMLQRRPEYDCGRTLAEFDPTLTDFGLAKLSDLEVHDTRSSVLIGTPLYVAPEQLERSASSSASARSDVYSLGVVLFEILTGHLPLNGDGYAELLDNVRSAKPKLVRELRPELPRDLETICAKCLQKSPSDRYQTAAELSEDLRRCLSGEPILGRRLTVLARFRYWATRRRRIKQAGWFVMLKHSVFTVWAVVAMVVLPSLGNLSSTDNQSLLRDLVVLLSTSIVPSILLGWFVVQEKRWAIWVALIATTIEVPFIFRALIFEPRYFAAVYRDNPIFSFVDHAIVLILLVIQLTLCGCAAAADIHRRRGG